MSVQPPNTPPPCRPMHHAASEHHKPETTLTPPFCPPLLQVTGDGSDFLAVGVLGMQGCGKSSFLNAMLPGHGHSHGHGDRDSDGAVGGGAHPFATEGPHHWAQQRHCTSTLELRVSR